MFKPNKRKLIIFAGGLAFIIFCASLILPFRHPALNILRLPLRLSSSLIQEFKGMIFYHRNYLQNQRLRQEIDLLQMKLNDLNEAALENVRLEELLSFQHKTPHKVIAARVIARSYDNWSSVVIIDKGRRQGIQRNMVAISFLGLLGKVIETTQSTSKIMLINDPNFAVSAQVGRSRQEGLASGTLGSSLVMRYLARESDIQPGDRIITSGLTGSFPKGLLIGTVLEVADEFSGLSRYAIIRPAANLSSVEELLIIIS